MEKLFETVLGMSGTASIVILLVLLARLALRRAPKVFSYALWAVVLFRLLCPFAIESSFSLLPAAQVEDVPGLGDAPAQVIQVQTGITTVDRQVNDFFLHHPYQGLPDLPEYAELPPQEPRPAIQQGEDVSGWHTVPAAVWLAGAVLLLGYSALSLLRLRRRLVGSVPLAGEKNVRLADHIPSPFVLGVLRPRIYLPSGLPEEERDYILLHERTHIRRCDHVLRALAWLALTIHWFNPLVWLAFHLAGKDMEMSCDEAVLRRMGRDVRADYSSSLLRLSTGKRLPVGPLAFGGGDPQSRIKNVLRYKKPAVWVIAAALIAVLCAGTALATNPSGSIIDPGSVAAVTSFSASSYTETPENTIVYTTADLREDLLNPVNPRTISPEDGAELVRLINSHRKTVYGRGELTLSGREHSLTRIDCAGGGFYLVDYWYWNGFSFNPFHAGEDSYTTLVTCFDASGNPGTTWQMEYGFDKAYQDWRSSLPDDGVPVSFRGERAADLTLSMDEGSVFVRIEGSIGGAALERTFWLSPDWSAQYPDSEAPYPLGKLWFYDKGVGCDLDACWTDESRSAVKVTATPQALISSYMPSGDLIYTVALTEDGGRLLELEGYLPKLSAGTPEIVPTEAEAVTAACIAAKLMTAAEDFYRNHQQSVTQDPRLDLTFYAGEYGECMVGGLGDLWVEWHPPKPLTPLNAVMYSVTGWLYLAGDPAVLCPRLAGESVEGDACWTDKTRSALQVQFNVNDDRVISGTVNGFSMKFTVDLERMAVTDRAFESLVEGEALELTDQEMTDMARVLSQVLKESEAYFYDAAANGPDGAPVPATQPPASASPAASPSPAPSDPPSPAPSDPPSPAPSAAPSASPEPEPVQSVFPSVPAPDLPGELICSSSYHMSGGDYRTVDFDAVPSGGKHIRFSFTDLSGKPVWVYLRRVDGNDAPGGEIVSSFPLEGGQQGWADYYADDADSGTYYVWIQSRVSGRDVVEGGTYVSQY